MKHYKAKTFLLGSFFGLQTFALSVDAAIVHTIDVLGIYSDHVAQRIADPEALFASNIEYANRALQNSGANYRYNLVHVEQQNWAADATVGANELISLSQDDEIQGLREQYGADLVAGVAPTGSHYCGIGYLPSADPYSHTFYFWASQYAYSLSGDTCGGRTMAHEMGHTMGLGHSPVQGSRGTIATWGRGWGVQNSFVTLMAYSSAYGVSGSAGRLQIHSNPDLSVCQGLACGSPVELHDGANATLALNLAAPQVETWMPAVVVPQNNPPVAVDDSAIVDQGDSIGIDVLSNDSDTDSDAIALNAVGEPLHGSAAIDVGSSRIVYTPNEDFFGEDTFNYTVIDSHGASAEGLVTVQVNEVVSSVPGNLAINGNVEAGIEGWHGWWDTSVALSADGHTGANSIAALEGVAIVVDLQTPFPGGREIAVSASVKSSEPENAYVFLRLTQDGVPVYWYVSSLLTTPDTWVDVQGAPYVSTASTVEKGELLFYFRYGITGTVLVDDVVVK